MSDNREKNDKNIKTGKKKNTWKSIGSAVVSLGTLAVVIWRELNNNNNQKS